MELEYNIHFKICTIINLKYKSNNNNLGLFFQKLKEKVEKAKKASEDLSRGTPKSADAKKAREAEEAREAEAKEAKELHQKVKNTTF